MWVCDQYVQVSAYCSNCTGLNPSLGPEYSPPFPPAPQCTEGAAELVDAIACSYGPQ